MAKYTDKQYYIEERLREVLDLMVDRCTKQNHDNLLIMDGREGYGKTTMSINLAYYIGYKTGRKFSEENIFFDLNKMMEFATKNKEQIIIWDEAALGGLSTQWNNKMQQKLIQLLMVSRKKRHFWLFNIPRFNKLSEYIILDRAIGLIHVYSPDEIKMGYFTYYNSKSKDILYQHWKSTKHKDYNKYKTFRGTFPNILKQHPNIIDQEAYDKKKDEAILSICKKKEKVVDKRHITRWVILYKAYQFLLRLGHEKKTINENLGVNLNYFSKLKDELKDFPDVLDKRGVTL